jgi:hypothetical protein
MPSQADVLTAFSEEALHDFQRPYQPPGKGLDSSGIPGYYKGRLKHATAEDVNSAVSHYSTAVLERWNTLKSRYTERHQDIKDGWLAMNNKTRRTVLLGALPGIPKDHSPHWKVWLDHTEHTKDDDPKKSTQNPIPQKHRTKFLCPSINQADLLKRDLLWIFISARASNTPDHFAHADMNEISFGCEVSALTSLWLDAHVVTLRHSYTEAGQTETYGQLYEEDDPSYNDRGAKLFDLYDFPLHKGLLILKQQAIIYDFLSKYCEGITKWADSNSKPYTSIEHFPIPAPLEKDAGEAQYRLPFNLDLTILIEVISSQKVLAENHVWSLREDSGYYLHFLEQFYDHRAEHVPLAKSLGRVLSPDDIGRGAMTGGTEDLILSSILDLEFWSSLERYIRELADLERESRDTIVLQNDLPEKLLIAFLVVLHFLDGAALMLMARLKKTIIFSPQLRIFFEGQQKSDLDPATDFPGRRRGSTGITAIACKIVKNPPKLASDAFESLMLLSRTVDATPTALMFQVQRLKELIESDIASKVFSDLFIERVNHLSIVFHCANQINLYQLWAAGFRTKLKTHGGAVLKLMGDDLTLFKSISAITIPGNILRLGNSDHDRLRYPANDRRTKIRVERIRTSEANLDRLWEAVDRHLERSTITLPYLRQLLNSNRKLHRTSEYVAYQEDSQALPPPLMESLSEYYWKFQSSTESTINHALSAAPKPKVKTRPQAQVS